MRMLNLFRQNGPGNADLDKVLQAQAGMMEQFGKMVLLLQTQAMLSKQEVSRLEAEVESLRATHLASQFSLDSLVSSVRGSFISAEKTETNTSPSQGDRHLSAEIRQFCNDLELYPLRHNKPLTEIPEKQKYLEQIEKWIFQLSETCVQEDSPVSDECVAYWMSAGQLPESQANILRNGSLSERLFRVYDHLGGAPGKVHALRIDRKVFEGLVEQYCDDVKAANLGSLVREVTGSIEESQYKALQKSHSQGHVWDMFRVGIARPMASMLGCSMGYVLYPNALSSQDLAKDPIWRPVVKACPENYDLFLAQSLGTGQISLQHQTVFEPVPYLHFLCFFDAKDGNGPWVCQIEEHCIGWQQYSKTGLPEDLSSPFSTAFLPKDPTLEEKRSAVRKVNGEKVCTLRLQAKEALEKNPKFMQAALSLKQKHEFIAQLSYTLCLSKNWHQRLSLGYECNVKDPNDWLLMGASANQWGWRAFRAISPDKDSFLKSSTLLKRE
jgi:hypothetical protein